MWTTHLDCVCLCLPVLRWISSIVLLYLPISVAWMPKGIALDCIGPAFEILVGQDLDVISTEKMGKPTWSIACMFIFKCKTHTYLIIKSVYISNCLVVCLSTFWRGVVTRSRSYLGCVLTYCRFSRVAYSTLVLPVQRAHTYHWLKLPFLVKARGGEINLGKQNVRNNIAVFVS